MRRLRWALVLTACFMAASFVSLRQANGGRGTALLPAAEAGNQARDLPVGLYVIDADGGNRTLVRPGAAYADPQWLPDGGRLLFWEPVSREAKVIPVAGGDAVAVLDDLDRAFGLPMLSPDGSLIAAVRPTAEGRDIFLCKTDGTDLTRLTTLGDVCVPLWSPGGNSLLVRRGGVTDCGYWLVPIDGGAPQRITEGISIAGADWAADGESFACETGEFDPDGGFFGDSIVRVWVPNGETQSLADEGACGPLRWSPVGARMLFTLYDELVCLDTGTGDLVGLHAKPSGYAWSPDGNAIAAVLGDDEGAGLIADLCIWRPEDDSLVRITDDRSLETQPAWSPDGTRIAFILAHQPGAIGGGYMPFR